MTVSRWGQGAVLTACLVLLDACGSPAAPLASPAASETPMAVAPAASKAPGAAQSSPATQTSSAGAAFIIAVTNQSPTNLYLWYALDKGIFAKHGLKVDLPIMSGQAEMDTVIAGHADATLHTGADLVFNSEAATHIGLRVVATGSRVSDSYIVTRNDITSLGQLRGKKFAMQSTTTGASQLVIRMLRQEGLEPNKDYQIILTGNQGQVAGVLAAIQAGAADAAAITPAIARPALQAGQVHVLVDLAKRTDLPTGSNVLAMTQATVDKRGGDIQKIVDSWMQAEQAISGDKAGAEELIKKYFKIDDPAALDEAWQRHLDTTAKIPLPAKEQFTDIVAAMPKDQQLTDAQFTAMIQPRFVEDAVKRGLGKW